MKYLYVIISDLQDIYFEQAYISILSLKESNPNAFISILTDSETKKNIDESSRSSINNFVDEFIVVNIPSSFSKKHKSSWLKTSMRSYISGDFLFIDSDTIILNKIDESLFCGYLIGAVPDLHRKFSEHINRDKLNALFKELGFVFNNENYYNSGVLFVKDCPETTSFFKLWHMNWLKNKDMCKYDQPLLAMTNNSFNIIKEMQGVFNCQIMYGIHLLNKASIVHYFASNFVTADSEKPFKLMDKQIFLNFRNSDYKVVPQYSNVHSLIRNNCELVPLNCSLLLHSYSFKIFSKIYNKRNIFWRTLEKICVKMSSNK